MTRALHLIRRRLLTAIPVLFLVILGSFFLLELAPGDAVDAYILTTGASDAGMIEDLRQAWGLDQSAAARLGAYLAALARFDLGWSVSLSRPILDVILERLPNTLLYSPKATFPEPNALLTTPQAMFPRPNALMESPKATFPRPNALLESPWAAFKWPNALLKVTEAVFS